MKNYLFIILVSIFTLFFTSNVFALSTNEATELCRYETTSKIEYANFVKRDNVDFYSVFFTNSKQYYLVSGSEGNVWHAGFQVKYLPKEFSSTALVSLRSARSIEGYTANFDIYFYNSSTTSLGASNLITHCFDMVFDSEQEFFDTLAGYNNFNDFLSHKLPSANGRLPLLSFKIKQALTMGQGLTDAASVKYTFSWSVSEHEIYANNPNKYSVQMLATSKYTQKDISGTSTVVAEDIGYINPECNVYVDKGIPIYKETYSFLERTYREKLCEIAGVDKSASSAPLSYYFLFVRVVEPETGKSSLWKVYRCQGRNISQGSYYYDDEGNDYASNNNEDEIDDKTNFDSDPSTDDTKSPTSSNYNSGAEMDAEHLLNNLEEIIATLKGIPELFEKVFLWMPDYLIVLIATSIGLLLVVGFVKLFLR